MIAVDMQTQRATELKSRRGRLWALTVELWVLLVLACFFVVRVLDSALVGHILSRICLAHAK
jgi:hypothetical protein